MTETRGGRACFVALTTLAHIAAGIEYALQRGPAPAPAHWNEQVAGLLLLSALLSALLSRTAGKDVRTMMVAAQFCIMLIATYPEGGSRAARTILTALCVFEVFVLTGPLRAAGIGAAMIVLGFYGIDFLSMWTERAALEAKAGDALLVFGPLSAGIAAALLRKALETARTQREMIGRLDKAVGRLTDANADFQEYAAEAEQASAVNERKRIARDIHDTVGYHLMNVIMMMEAGIDIVPDASDKLRDILLQTRDQAKEGLKETRNAMRALRAVDGGRQRGIQAVEKLISVFERVTGVSVQREYGNLPTNLPQDEFALIYRMVQEGLTNSFKHGRATRIVLQFWIDDERILRVRIRDNGMGLFGELAMGVGLAGLRERVERLRGTLRAGNVVDGFELAVAVPLGSGGGSAGGADR